VIRPTPAIVTQLAARRLPRWVLALLALFYVLPGFLGRDPWRNDDLAAFGVMLELANHSGAWWQPGLLGEPAITAGWLPYWLGAVFIQLFSFLPADLAAKLPFAGLLFITLGSTWYGVLHLARLPAAQPVVFAFGGEAHPVDYARATADAALLALVASLGLALLAHETSVDAARLAFTALAFHAAARSLSPYARHQLKTLGLWWLSAWGLALSGMPGLALWLAFLTALPHLLPRVLLFPGQPAAGRSLALAGLTGSALAASLVFGLSGLEADSFRTLSHWQHHESWRSLGRLLLWFTWPAGLLAIWAVWSWRRQWRCAHWLLPVTWVASILTLMWLEGGRDRTLLLALPMLACLAAFALPTLRRSVTAWLDWFALLFFSGSAVVIWIYWLAMTIGVPTKPAATVTKLFPTFEPAFSWVSFIPALLVTLGWIGIMVWRIGRHRPALWKSLVLSASGSTLCWVLLMTLWLPLLNHGMGQAPISQRVAAVTPAGSCVAVHGLGHAQIAGLRYHGQLQVERAGQASAERCTRLVVDTADDATLSTQMDMTQWKLMNRIPRLRENRETWMVFEREVD